MDFNGRIHHHADKSGLKDRDFLENTQEFAKQTPLIYCFQFLPRRNKSRFSPALSLGSHYVKLLSARRISAQIFVRGFFVCSVRPDDSNWKLEWAVKTRKNPGTGSCVWTSQDTPRSANYSHCPPDDYLIGIVNTSRFQEVLNR